MRAASNIFALAAAVAAFAAPARAQDSQTQQALRDSVRARIEAQTRTDIITPHITDAHHIEYPCVTHGVCEKELPRWAPVHIGSFALDLSPTKLTVMLFISAFLCLAVMLTAARGARKQRDADGRVRGFAGAMQAVVLYVRNEVVIPNVGPHGEGFAPFVLTLFFFILFANMLGLIPFGATATGNISVTATLAIVTFIVIEVASMVALGKGYINTVVYWPHDMSLPMKSGMTLIMTPVELISHFTKPFALAIRLFANMTAGHVVLLAFISLIFTFHSWALAPVPVLMGVAVSLLEVMVALVQAFIFALLASVFIGLGRQAAH
jgi:F-type H+-transporting ATPase subunit a